jgi:hypothetical protein
MTSRTPSDPLKKCRGLWQHISTRSRAPHKHSTAAGILAVSKPILAFSPSQLHLAPIPRESSVVSVYRNTSDTAQAFLPPVQAVADVIPGVGGIIKGVIGGILSTLQLVDRYIRNKDDMEELTQRLHRLLRLIDDAPVARTTSEETMRQWLLSALETDQSQLDIMEKRIRGSPSLTQDIAGCVTRIHNHLSQYTAFSVMNLQNDMYEVKTSMEKMVESHARQIQAFDSFMATGGAGRLPAGISRGHAVLIDATGREHVMLLEQCRYFDQLDAMLCAMLFQCRPDEAEIQRWYIERKQYDFVIDDGTDVIQLTRESDIWSHLESGTRIVMRVIIEEEVAPTMTAIYKCPCGTPNTVTVSVEDLTAALQCGFTITWLAFSSIS